MLLRDQLSDAPLSLSNVQSRVFTPTISVDIKRFILKGSPLDGFSSGTMGTATTLTETLKKPARASNCFPVLVVVVDLTKHWNCDPGSSNSVKKLSQGSLGVRRA
eukprot:TRINITY_DN68127_c8_g1_i1.p2 TRINITY_DN68127_c8_g1~~TRINITY_DN68127_c8_g1_i1.p2  ORF type:complete len:105 (-),score=4.97 TRINITY_DN68127_c8_g1_i1:221-535(-)